MMMNKWGVPPRKNNQLDELTRTLVILKENIRDAMGREDSPQSGPRFPINVFRVVEPFDLLVNIAEYRGESVVVAKCGGRSFNPHKGSTADFLVIKRDDSGDFFVGTWDGNPPHITFPNGNVIASWEELEDAITDAETLLQMTQAEPWEILLKELDGLISSAGDAKETEAAIRRAKVVAQRIRYQCAIEAFSSQRTI